MTQQQRCVYCVKHKRVGSDKRAIRTSWTCICHPDKFCCKKSECWIEHLADNECGHSDNNEANTRDADSDGSSSASDDDDGSSRSPRVTSVALPAPRLRSSDHNLD